MKKHVLTARQGFIDTYDKFQGLSSQKRRERLDFCAGKVEKNGVPSYIYLVSVYD